MTLLGFRTQREAIWALDEDGVPPAEIASRLGCKVATVHARLAEKRKRGGFQDSSWTPKRLAKARRIHRAALGVIAEALGVSVASLQAVVLGPDSLPAVVKAREDHRVPDRGSGEGAQPLVPPEAVGPGPDGPAEGAAISSLGPDGLQATGLETGAREAAPARRYGLKGIDGKWLTRDGRAFSAQIENAWSGSAEDAKLARQRLSLAKFCKLQVLP